MQNIIRYSLSCIASFCQKSKLYEPFSQPVNITEVAKEHALFFSLFSHSISSPSYPTQSRWMYLLHETQWSGNPCSSQHYQDQIEAINTMDTFRSPFSTKPMCECAAINEQAKSAKETPHWTRKQWWCLYIVLSCKQQRTNCRHEPCNMSGM